MWQRIHKVPKRANFRNRQLRIFLSLLLGALFVGWWLLPASAQQTIPFDDYLRLIGRANSQVQSAVGQSPAQCSNILTEVAAELTAVTHVQLPDGTIMPVNHAGAENFLQAPCNPQAALTYLTGICPIRICPIAGQPADEQISSDTPTQAVPPAGSSETNPANGSTAGPTANGDAQIPASGTGTQSNGEESLPDTAGGDTAVSPNANTADPGTTTAGGKSTTGAEPAESTQNGSAETAVSDQSDSASQGEGEGDPAGNPTDTSATAAEGEGTTGEGTLPDNAEAEASQPTETATEGETAVPNPEPLPDENIETEETGSNQTQIILIVLIILIVFAAALLGIYLWRIHQEEARRRKRQGKPASSAAAVAEGRRQIEEENYREAVRQLFLATLLALEERGILQFDKTLTNYELLTKMRGNPGIMTTLRSVVGTVERVWYGFETLAAVEYETLVKEINALKYAQEK